MRAVITVVGKDKPGILSSSISQQNVLKEKSISLM